VTDRTRTSPEALDEILKAMNGARIKQGTVLAISSTMDVSRMDTDNDHAVVSIDSDVKATDIRQRTKP
jgi:hypothetical protein